MTNTGSCTGIPFWCRIKKCNYAAMNFSTIANFALKLLLLPYSNAEVERIFSMMKIIKGKSF